MVRVKSLRLVTLTIIKSSPALTRALRARPSEVAYLAALQPRAQRVKAPG